MDFHSLINTAKQNVNTGVKKVCFEILNLSNERNTNTNT